MRFPVIRHWLRRSFLTGQSNSAPSPSSSGPIASLLSRAARRKQSLRQAQLEHLEPRQVLAVEVGVVGGEGVVVNPNSNIDTQLQLLVAQPNNAQFRAATQVDAAGRVAVRVATFNKDLAHAALRPLGFQWMGEDPQTNSLDGWLPISRVNQAAALTGQGVGALTTIAPPVLRSGTVQTQGDSVVRGDRVRQFFTTAAPNGYTGAGVSIGVISDSYNVRNGAGVDVSSQNLPTNVRVVLEGATGGTDEGRAMMQIIYDVAPDAQLLFHAAGSSETTMAAAIRALRAAGATIIVDDIGFRTEPIYQDGPISQAIDEVTAAGVTFFSAVGNLGNRGYEQTQIRTAVDSLPTISNGTFIDFDTTPLTDTRQRMVIPNGGSIDIVLQWDDPVRAAGQGDTDLDMFLVNSATGAVVASGTTNSVASGLPFERLLFTNSTAALDYDLLIRVRNAGATPLTRLKWIDWGGDFRVTISDFTYNAGTAVGHVSAAGAIGVGAVDYSNHLLPTQSTSRGPSTFLFDVAGTRLATPINRPGAQIVAPDNVNTSFFGADTALDADTFPNFAGTSASAPHAAAVAALLKQARPTLTPTQIRDQLRNTAIDAGITVGFDADTGAGLVDAWRAIYGNSTPFASTNPSFTFTEGFEPSTVVPPIPPFNLNQSWDVNTNGNGRVSIGATGTPDTGVYHLVLDAQDPGSTGSLAAATLNVNLNKLAGATLRFRQKEFSDGDNPMPSTFTNSSNSDGVAISFDGTTYFRLISLTGSNTNNFYRTFSFDLNQAAQQVGRQLGSSVKIRFQSFSTSNPSSTNQGGMAFDNISVVGTLVNNPPTLTFVGRFSGATEDTPFNISAAQLMASANEFDPDNDPLQIGVASVAPGATLLLNGQPISVPTVLGASDVLTWTAPVDVNGMGIPAFKIFAFDGSSNSTPPIDVTINVTPVDDPPRFVQQDVIPGSARNAPVTISFDDFTRFYRAIDPDTAGGISYAINSVTNGRLTKNGVPVVPGESFGMGDVLVYTPPNQVLSIVNAFKVDAFGPGGIQAPVPGQVRISLPNGRPVMEIVGTLGGAVEDTPLTFDYDALLEKSRARDPDGDTTAFKITGVVPGARVQVNGVDIVPNQTLIGRDDFITFTPPANQNGNLVGFFMVATDGDLDSQPALPVTFGVIPIYDPPTVTNPPPVIDAIDAIGRTFTYEELVRITGGVAVEGPLVLRITDVLSGSVLKNGQPVVPNVTTLSPGESVVWFSTTGVFGLQRAFGVVALDGQTVSPRVEITADKQLTRFFRTFNPNADYHFFTTNFLEFSLVVNRGLHDESTGQPGFAISTRQTDVSTPLFRLRNPNNGRHYYTQNSAERDILIGMTWIDERNDGFIFTSQLPGTVPLHRLYNIGTGSHLYTESDATKAAILSLFPNSWFDHGTVGFVFPIGPNEPSQLKSPTNVPEVQRATAAVSRSATAESASASVDGSNVASLVATSTTRSSSPTSAAASTGSTPVSPLPVGKSAKSGVTVDEFFQSVGQSLTSATSADLDLL
jgi:hypothetical protein